MSWPLNPFQHAQEYGAAESDMHFLLEMESGSSSSFGTTPSIGPQGHGSWASMGSSTLSTLYESQQMAHNARSVNPNQSQSLALPAFKPEYRPVAMSGPHKSLLSQRLAAQSKLQVQGFEFNGLAQENTVDPNLLSPSSASLERVHVLPPQGQHTASMNKDQFLMNLDLNMDIDLSTFSPDVATPPEPSWSALSSQPINIPGKQPSHGRANSISLSHRHQHNPYPRSPYTHNPELMMSSFLPISPASLMDFSTSHHPSSVMTGFTDSQLAAAQNIVQFQATHPGSAIPAVLITSDLAEIYDSKGWCLIGNCGVERIANRLNPQYDPSSDKKRKRLDHLYDHIRDKHFGCRPHHCYNCSATFAREHDLKRHEKTHTAVSLPCAFCEKVYTRKDNLQRHKDVKHPNSAPASSFNPQ